jgi:lysophospholipase L1-like esterase
MTKGKQMKQKCSWIATLVILAMSAQQCRSQELAVHEGDRVVFYGDSITAQRLYTRFVEDFVLTRYPQMHVTFWNAGVPGDTVYGGYTGDMATRLKRDLLPRQPTVVTILLGINDGYYMAFNQKYLDIYKDGYRKLIDSIRTDVPSAGMTLVSPTPYDEVTHGTEFAHYNEVVSRHAAFVRELAASAHLAFSDFNQAESNLLIGGTQRNSSLASLLVPDRIHPAEASHWLMAATLARSWGISPIVSSLRIDGAAGKVVAALNTQIADLGMTGDRLHWKQTDNALPLPLPLDDPMIQLVLSASDLAMMDRQILGVDGLHAARYMLKIDGQKIASLTREQLSSGVNLALFATPMESQARGIDGIELKRTRLDEARFILAIEDPKVSEDADSLNAMEVKDAALAAGQRTAAQPKPHAFELSPE